MTNLHRYESGGRPARLEEERQRACRPGAVEFLRKARDLVKRDAVTPGRALSEVWDHRDPYGAIAVASVALGRAAGEKVFDFESWSAGRPTEEVLAAFDRAIASLC